MLTVLSSLLLSISAGPSVAQAARDFVTSQSPAIHIEDVKRFYELYRRTDGLPTEGAVQTDYLDRASPGLRRLAQLRNFTAAGFVRATSQKPEMYENAQRCMAVLPRGRERVRRALKRLGRIYPQARFPDITIAIGPGKPLGVADETGVMIDLESLCAVTWLEPNLEDRFVHAVVHEYGHVQQATMAPEFYNKAKPSLLELSLIEGAAEFIDKLASGSVSDTDLQAIVKGRERAIEEHFVADEDKTDLSDWLYNGTLTKPGDLGYWVGYRIVASFYAHSTDRRRAVREIVQIKDAKVFLARSGWYPGIHLKG